MASLALPAYRIDAMPTPSTRPGVTVADQSIAARRKTDLSLADGALCLACLDGTATLDDDTGTYPLREGTLVVRVAPWSGSLQAGTRGVRLVSYTWSGAALQALGPARVGLIAPRVLQGRSSVELSWRAANELRLADRFTPDALQVFAQGVAISLARNIAYRQRGIPPHVERARAHIERHLTTPLDVARLARLAGVSAASLSRRFRHAFGFPPTAYHARLRIDRARELLTEGKSVHQTAAALGFHDASHLARTFRRATGMSPGEFQARRARVTSVPIGRIRTRRQS